MEETALAFTDFASYCLTTILLLQNSPTFASFSNFPDQIHNSLTVGTLVYLQFSPCLKDRYLDHSQNVAECFAKVPWVFQGWTSQGDTHTHLNYSSIATKNTTEIPFYISSFFLFISKWKSRDNRAISEKVGQSRDQKKKGREKKGPVESLYRGRSTYKIACLTTIIASVFFSRLLAYFLTWIATTWLNWMILYLCNITLINFLKVIGEV